MKRASLALPGAGGAADGGWRGPGTPQPGHVARLPRRRTSHDRLPGAADGLLLFVSDEILARPAEATKAETSPVSPGEG